MQVNFTVMAYAVTMTAKNHCADLKALREAAGLSLRELARQIGEDHSNVRYWETSGHTQRSDVLIPMAKALGVTVEELLGEAKPKRVLGPGGRLGQVFEAAARLPQGSRESRRVR